MVFGWFDTRAAKEFGRSLALHYDEKVRANEKAAVRKQAGKQAKLGAEIVRQVVEFKQKSRPNFLQRASMGNAFKWQLNDLGYDSASVDQLTKDILIALG